MSILSHVSIGVSDYAASLRFYDAVLATLGAKRIMQHEGEAAAWGREFPEFWIHRPLNRQPPSAGNGTHFAFLAPDAATVHRFFDEAVRCGAVEDGAPGPRPQYSARYYGAFVVDRDGHKIEVMAILPPPGDDQPAA